MNVDSREFRYALGRFATGVCVVAAEPDDHFPIGMTVNSFSSVSLDPPLILWSLRNESHMLPLFDSLDHFSVNIVSEKQQALSNLYAAKGDHRLHEEHFDKGETEVPVINDAIATFECKRWAKYPGGDHTIYVGEVVAVKNKNEQKPLIFNASEYCELK